MSVPHTPTASVSTRTAPSAAGGSGTSSSRAEPAVSGCTVSAFIAPALLFRRSCPAIFASADRRRSNRARRRDGGEPVHGPGRAPHRRPALRSRCSSGTTCSSMDGCPDRLYAELTSDTWEKAWGKLPTWRPATHVVLLGQQPEVVAQADEPVEHGVGVVVAADQVQAVGHPERAGQEGALVPGEPVDGPGVRGAVAQHEPVLGQLPLDGLDGGAHAVVGGGKEAHQRDHEQAGVEGVGAVVLREGPDVGVVALGAHLVVDAVAQRRASDRAGPSRPKSSMVRTARSTATQAMTLEWVKCRRGPRTSQMPSSGSSQCVGHELHQRRLQVPGRRARARCPPVHASYSAEMTSPYTSSWNWPDAALPTRTGAEPS